MQTRATFQLFQSSSSSAIALLFCISSEKHVFFCLENLFANTLPKCAVITMTSVDNYHFCDFPADSVKTCVIYSSSHASWASSDHDLVTPTGPECHTNTHTHKSRITNMYNNAIKTTVNFNQLETRNRIAHSKSK